MVARASFLIWAYWHSVSDIDREANATGFQVELPFWRITAPSQNADASAEIFVGIKGSYRASVAPWVLMAPALLSRMLKTGQDPMSRILTR